jgi:hypothetical protein
VFGTRTTIPYRYDKTFQLAGGGLLAFAKSRVQVIVAMLRGLLHDAPRRLRCGLRLWRSGWRGDVGWDVTKFAMQDPDSGKRGERRLSQWTWVATGGNLFLHRVLLDSFAGLVVRGF